MPQISKHRLDKTLQEEMFVHFWSSIANLRTTRAVANFFSDLLTHTEEVMLAKRLTIAVLLMRDKRPIDIAHALHVSFSTIGRVSTWVSRAKPETKHELERIIKTSQWQVFFDKIEALIDTFPPRYGTDWSKAGKEKFIRAQDRATRASLR